MTQWTGEIRFCAGDSDRPLKFHSMYQELQQQLMATLGSMTAPLNYTDFVSHVLIAVRGIIPHAWQRLFALLVDPVRR